MNKSEIFSFEVSRQSNEDNLKHWSYVEKNEKPKEEIEQKRNN